MRALLAYVVRGRLHAIGATTACAVMSLVLAPFSYLSGAVVGLATLRYGAYEGFIVLSGSALAFGALSAVVIHTAVPALLMALVTWAPGWLLASVLRATASQGTALTLAGMLGVFVILGFHMLIDDVAGWWRELLDQLLARGIDELRLEPEAGTLERVERLLDLLAPWMTGLLAAGIMFGAVLTLLLARWWHAVLDNPGGFAKEFRALKLDRRVGVAVVAIALVAIFADQLTGGLAREILCVAMVLYMFQGLALAHSVVAQKGASVGWLVGLYALAVLVTPQMLLLLTVTGFLDTWFDVRSRVRRGTNE